MSSKRALANRGEAEAVLSQALRKLADATVAEIPNSRLIKNGLTKAHKLYDEFVKKHVALVTEVGATMNDPTYRDYLNLVSDSYSQGVDAAEAVLATLENVEEEGGFTILLVFFFPRYT